MPAAKEGKWAGSTWTNTKNAARISSTCLGARQGAVVVVVVEEEEGRLEEQDVGMVTKSSLPPRCLCVRQVSDTEFWAVAGMGGCGGKGGTW